MYYCRASSFVMTLYPSFLISINNIFNNVLKARDVKSIEDSIFRPKISTKKHFLLDCPSVVPQRAGARWCYNVSRENTVSCTAPPIVTAHHDARSHSQQHHNNSIKRNKSCYSYYNMSLALQAG